MGRLMADPAGRRWVNDMLAAGGIWLSTPPSNALRMAWFEGERNQALRLLSEIQEANPEAVFQMMREHSSERPTKPRGADADSPSPTPSPEPVPSPTPEPTSGEPQPNGGDAPDQAASSLLGDDVRSRSTRRN